MGFFERTIAVVGMLGDKDIAGSLSMLKGKIDVWLLAGLDTARGASAAELASILAKDCPSERAECFASPAEAYAHAAKLAGENDRIVVFGSFYTVAAVLRELKDST
jgi:dihydrofolate synthase/folylpolyglutamate synthase